MRVKKARNRQAHRPPAGDYPGTDWSRGAMADPTAPLALDALARLAARRAYGQMPDRLLLDRFAADRDEVAFAALVERHGAVVLDAARAVLRHAQDAED